MDFIQSSNKQVDKFGPGKHGFSAGNPTGGILATFFSNLWADNVQQELINAIEASGLAVNAADQTQLTQAIRRLGGGVVGTARGLRASLTAAGASITFVADEVVVASALGTAKLCLPSLNKTLNTATVGVGGMDVGAAPASGYVAIYAIFNPTTGVSALLGVNATAAAAPQVYGGANMPAGFTMSALVSVWPTNGSGLFVVGNQRDRRVSVATFVALSTGTQQPTPAPLSIAGFAPPNAISVRGYVSITNSAAASLQQGVGSTVAFVGFILSSGNTFQALAGMIDVDLATAQTYYYIASASSGTPTITHTLTSYTF